MKEGTVRGNPVIWSESEEKWLWADTLTPSEHYADDGDYRSCTFCNKMPIICEKGCKYRHDACLGHIEGASSACCGHGIFVGYVNWPGLIVRDGWFGPVKLVEKVEEVN